MSNPALLEQTLADGSPAFFKNGAAYGKARGVGRAAVSKWNKQGLLIWVDDPVSGRPVIDAAASDRRRGVEQNPVKQQASAGAAGSGAPVSEAFVEASDGGDDAPDGAVAPPAGPSDPSRMAALNADAVSKQYAARMRKLDYEQRIGNLVAKSAVETRLRRMAGRFVQAMMMVSVQAAERANPGDPRRARSAIDEVMRSALQRFAEEGLAELVNEAAEESEALELETVNG
ncbi:hypothetical protein [Maricaulis sp.]|uniref:hypothetical protein n=1 Tax=Maricaulis sp. TaxID=1486257 RepID=UPI003A8D3F9E